VLEGARNDPRRLDERIHLRSPEPDHPTELVGRDLLAATVLVVGAELSRFGRLVSVADVVAIPLVRRVVHGAVGVGLAASTVAAVGAGSGGGGATPAPTRADLRLAAAAATTEPGTATMTPLDEPAPGTATMAPVEPTGIASSAPLGDTWVAAPGDHLWSIAAATLRSAWGRGGSVTEVAGYWEQVVEANRAALPDPDLLPVGTTVLLPPIPPVPPG
jgi:hypothetical protein